MAKESLFQQGEEQEKCYRVQKQDIFAIFSSVKGVLRYKIKKKVNYSKVNKESGSSRLLRGSSGSSQLRLEEIYCEPSPTKSGTTSPARDRSGQPHAGPHRRTHTQLLPHGCEEAAVGTMDRSNAHFIYPLFSS